MVGEEEGVAEAEEEEEEVEIGIETKTNCDLVELIIPFTGGISYCIQKVIQLLFCQLLGHLPDDSFTSTNSKPQYHQDAEQCRIIYQYQGMKSQRSKSAVVLQFN